MAFVLRCSHLNRALQGIMKILLTLMILLSTSAYGWENIDSEFSVLNTDMRHMWSGGGWNSEEKEGFYRILVAGGGYEHYKSKLYIQWVVHGTDMDAPKVLSTVEIKELNENPLYSFNLPKCIGNWQCGRIEVDATNTYDLSNHKFSIELVGVGKYKFAPSTL